MSVRDRTHPVKPVWIVGVAMNLKLGTSYKIQDKDQPVNFPGAYLYRVQVVNTLGTEECVLNS